MPSIERSHHSPHLCQATGLCLTPLRWASVNPSRPLSSGLSWLQLWGSQGWWGHWCCCSRHVVQCSRLLCWLLAFVSTHHRILQDQGCRQRSACCSAHKKASRRKGGVGTGAGIGSASIWTPVCVTTPTISLLTGLKTVKIINPELVNSMSEPMNHKKAGHMACRAQLDHG